jgi:hypothetical protein
MKSKATKRHAVSGLTTDRYPRNVSKSWPKITTGLETMGSLARREFLEEMKRGRTELIEAQPVRKQGKIFPITRKPAPAPYFYAWDNSD